MNDKFSIEADRAHGLVRIRMSGLFTLDDVRDFYETRRRVHAALGLPKNEHLTLNDVRDLKILPQQTLAAFCDMLADPDFHSRRLAFVVGPTLVRGQVVRARDRRTNPRCLGEVEEAVAWRLAETPAAVQPLRRAVGS